MKHCQLITPLSKPQSRRKLDSDRVDPIERPKRNDKPFLSLFSFENARTLYNHTYPFSTKPFFGRSQVEKNARLLLHNLVGENSLTKATLSAAAGDTQPQTDCFSIPYFPSRWRRINYLNPEVQFGGQTFFRLVNEKTSNGHF